MNPDFENAFYYFASTLPQVLGALLALVAVFILFKFESFNKRINGLGLQVQNLLEKKFDKHMSDNILTHNLTLSSGISTSDIFTVLKSATGLTEELENIYKETPKVVEIFRAYVILIEECIDSKNELKRQIKSLVIHSIIIIAISLLSIIFTPILSNLRFIYLQFSILGLSFLYFMYCLWIILSIITNTTSDLSMFKS